MIEGKLEARLEELKHDESADGRRLREILQAWAGDPELVPSDAIEPGLLRTWYRKTGDWKSLSRSLAELPLPEDMMALRRRLGWSLMVAKWTENTQRYRELLNQFELYFYEH